MARLFTREIDGKTHYYSVAPRFWVPYDAVFSVEKNEDRRTAERFQKWVEMGLLTVTDGAEVDYRYILEEAKAANKLNPVSESPIDPFGATGLSHDLADESLNPITIVQNYTNMSDPTKELEAAIESGRFHHDGNPIMSWCISNVGKGFPRELIPVNPKKVIVLKGPDGMPYYELPEIGETLPMRMMHHVKVFSLDGYIGSSPIQTNADVLGLSLAVEEHASQVFRRGCTMSGVIERPKDAPTIKSQDAIDRLLAKWTDRYSGVRNAFSVALLQEGMSYKQLSQDNEKAQLLQSRQWGVEEVCRLYKIPPHMVQMLAKATNNNIEHQGLQFVMYTLLAWLKRHEGALMRDLLLPSERSDLYIEFNVSGLLRGDQKSRYESYALGRQWGWLSVNDIRRMENLPPIAGGDKYLTPLNMVDSKQILPGNNTPTTKQLAEINSILSRN